VVRLRTLTLSAVGGKDLSQVSRPLQLAHCRSEIPRFLMIVNTYAAGATFTMGTANVTLYAQWTLIAYDVTYNGNGASGGSVPVDGSTYAPGATVTVLGNTGGLTRSGYSFVGWNTAANGSGTNYAVGATFTMGAADVTLYARWSVRPTVVSLVRVNASPTMADMVNYTLTFVVAARDRDADVTYATIARVIANGTLDTNFGDGGVQDISSYTNATKVAVTAAGRLLTGLVLEDPAEGIRKAYVVQLSSQTVIPTTTTISSIAPSPAVVGQAYTVSVAVTAASGTPDGTVIVNDGAGATCSITLDAAGTGSCALVSTTASNNKTITASSGGSSGYESSVGTRTLVVQALPTVQFSAPNTNVKGTAGSVTLTVKRSGSTLGAVSVAFATANGDATAGVDYVANSGVLNWAAGDGAAKTVTITILARSGNQPNRKFSVTLSSPSGATLGTPSTATVTVQK
jgi:uncharacterized repeat protein (TIGR02543 family)